MSSNTNTAAPALVPIPPDGTVWMDDMGQIHYEMRGDDIWTVLPTLPQTNGGRDYRRAVGREGNDLYRLEPGDYWRRTSGSIPDLRWNGKKMEWVNPKDGHSWNCSGKTWPITILNDKDWHKIPSPAGVPVPAAATVPASATAVTLKPVLTRQAWLNDLPNKADEFRRLFAKKSGQSQAVDRYIGELHRTGIAVGDYVYAYDFDAKHEDVGVISHLFPAAFQPLARSVVEISWLGATTNVYSSQLVRLKGRPGHRISDNSMVVATLDPITQDKMNKSTATQVV